MSRGGVKKYGGLRGNNTILVRMIALPGMVFELQLVCKSSARM